jgi:tetratricopeptide (TPR) repeat protein
MAPRAGIKSEPETLPANVIDESDVVEDDDVFAPIDRLLAETDQGWDVEAQVLTLKQAAATRPLTEQTPAKAPAMGSFRPVHLPTPFDLAPTQVPEKRLKAPSRLPKGPPPLPRQPPPPAPGAGSRSLEPSVRLPADMSQPGALIDLLNARVSALEGTSGTAGGTLGPDVDRVGLARAQMELAIASETILGDDERATSHAEAALRAEPTSAAAHAFLRRKKHSRRSLPAMLAHLEFELGAATTEAHHVELLAEKARLLDAVGGRGGEVRATWEKVLAHAPNHTAALAGLESELVAAAHAGAAPSDWDALALHLARMAEAYATETRLAAWLHVERAQILERKLGRIDAARGALESALTLDPSIGPVRDQLVRHVVAHADWGSLRRLLDEEARIETSAARAVRLELDAAAVAAFRLGDSTGACELLARASSRAPTSPNVDRRVLDESVRLHEKDGRWTDAAASRRARLRFVTEPATIAYELRGLAVAAERRGDPDTAIADIQQALAVDATDATLVQTLDRLLSIAGRHDQRVAIWLQEAARTDDGARRSEGLLRAARICEDLGRRADALRHLRSAWVATPGDPEVLDALSRLLAPADSEELRGGARSLVELYAQAAAHVGEVGRKVAYLERAALLWEEVLADPERAARIYEQVLALEGDRHSAILGLERTAARFGDARMLARALLDEARLTTAEGADLALRTRAAAALAKHDPTRATQLVREVLARDASYGPARALETQLEEDAGRWEQAAKSLRARIESTRAVPEKVALWLALAQMQHVRLHAPHEALASLEHARLLDPTHPVPPEEIARVLEDRGDARALRDAIERLAAQARTPDERARHLSRAAEIDELVSGDDASAMRTYRRALAETPHDELIADRLSRVMMRCARHSGGRELAEVAALLTKRIEGETAPALARARSFQLATLLVELGQEATRATTLLESALTEPGNHVPALRTLESVRRRAGDPAPLARLLAAQNDELKDVRARLGALWNLASLEEWKLASGNPAATYQRILELDPTDPGALWATLRHELAGARGADPRARKVAIDALRTLVAFVSDDDSRLALQLGLSLMLEAAAADASDPTTAGALAREALDRYRDALRVDPLSVTASTGLGRLASQLGDTASGVAASLSLADLAVEAKVRCRYLVEGAELLMGVSDAEGLGPSAQRRRRAASLLERALDADPDSIPAAGRLATLTLEDGQSERLVSVFRAALPRAKSPDAVVMLGSEVARVARDELKDLTVAIDAMRLVRAAVPQHIPSLLTLAELCIAQRAWPEAVSALEAVVSTSREASPKLTALFALASIYERVLDRSEDVDRVLRAALALEPANARALRALLRRVAGQTARDTPAAERARRDEIADLLGRLSEVENDPEQRAALLLELSDVRAHLGNARAAEQALVQAVVAAPENARAFARLAALFRRGGAEDAVGYARALNAVIGLGQEAGRVDPRWLAALGQVEIHSLSRLRDGIAHLQSAIALDPTLYESRFELANAYANVQASDEATRVLLAMLSPLPHPLLSVADPAVALALLERTLSAEKRPDEAMVVSELRAIAGELDDGRRDWLRARRTALVDATPLVLDRSTLFKHVLPAEGRHVLVDVALAIAGVEAKVLRADFGELGISSRDRVSSRSGHPLRRILDRIAQSMGVEEVDLALAPKATRTRVVAQDEPWIVVPAAMGEFADPTQFAHMARALARVALGVPWLEELPLPNMLALLVAAARHVVPTYAVDEMDSAASPLVAKYAQGIGRALSRRQRRALEDLASRLSSHQPRLPVMNDFVDALSRAELRAAFLVGGDLIALLETMAPTDVPLREALAAPGPQALATVLQHPRTGDLVRFALTREATALRRRLGSTWTAPLAPL